MAAEGWRGEDMGLLFNRSGVGEDEKVLGMDGGDSCTTV